MVKRLLLLSVAIAALSGLGGLAQSPAGQGAGQMPPEIQERLLQMSGGAAEAVARGLGLTELAGKPLDEEAGPPGRERSPGRRDVAIAASLSPENEPTVAANPEDRVKLVAGSHRGSVCVVYSSSDGGATWTSGSAMPLRTGATCSDPVLAYAPDGTRVYYAYMDIRQTVSSGPTGTFVTRDFDIVVSSSDDNGATWSAPVTALDADPSTIRTSPPPQTITETGFSYDKPWVGTAVDGDDSDFVYVSATRFRDGAPGLPPSAIAFVRSSDRGFTWTSPTILDSGSDAAPSTPAVVVQGSRPAGGLDGEVLVAWYHSGPDGFLNGLFQIRTRRSGDHGASWDPISAAATELYEARFFLGPLDFYRRYWPVMMPDVEIDSGGEAHIAYTHVPLNLNLPANAASAEQGDIRYIHSSGAPYDVWSMPVTVNDDGPGRAQGFAALKIQHGGAESTVHIIWEDTRLSPNLPTSTPAACFSGPVPTRNCDSPNLFFDVFYARKVPGAGVDWFQNFRLSDSPSIQDFTFSGDYIDLAANDRGRFAVWTDRRDQTSVFASDDDVFGSGWGLIPGEPLFVETYNISMAPCDGLELHGVTYAYTVADVPSTACNAGTNAGPGVTNNIQAPNIEGSAAGVLRLRFKVPTGTFGFGVAQNTGIVPQIVTVDLFRPGIGELREELTLTETRDPTFVGGRFEYEGPAVSEVTIRFTSPATRFAIDNVTYRYRGQ